MSSTVKQDDGFTPVVRRTMRPKRMMITYRRAVKNIDATLELLSLVY